MDEQKKQKRVHGYKAEGQKYKSLLVMQYILKHADDEHAVTVGQIMDHLAKYGIEAERHSVSRDINDLMELLNKGAEGDPGDHSIFDYEIEYDAALHGYKLSQRPYSFEELRLLAECVRASKFISKGQEENLLYAIEGMCSEHQIAELQKEVYLVGRSKTTYKYIMGSMLSISRTGARPTPGRKRPCWSRIWKPER